MQLTDEQLEEFKAYAGDFHQPRDIGYMIGFSGFELNQFEKIVSDKETLLGEIYYVELLRSKAAIRKVLVASAKTGNPEALRELNLFFENVNFDNAG